MNLGDLRRVACPHCGRPHDLLVLFDALGAGWPQGPWADVRCPSCDACAQLAFFGEEVAIGFVTCAPRPRFEPTERMHQPGLCVRPQVDGLVIELLHRQWVVAYGDAARVAAESP